MLFLVLKVVRRNSTSRNSHMKLLDEESSYSSTPPTCHQVKLDACLQIAGTIPTALYHSEKMFLHLNVTQQSVSLSAGDSSYVMETDIVCDYVWFPRCHMTCKFECCQYTTNKPVHKVLLC